MSSISTKEYVEKLALKCLKLPVGQASEDGCMFTYLGQPTRFTESNWITRVKTPQYSTFIFVGPGTYYTVLYNLDKPKVYLLSIDEATTIEKESTREELRQNKALAFKNRLVVSTSPLLMRCFIPECLYVRLDPSSTSYFNQSNNNSNSSSIASECFSQNSFHMLEMLSNETMKNRSLGTLFKQLTSVDNFYKEIFQIYKEFGVVSAKQFVVDKYGENVLELVLMSFVLSHPQMRMKLDITNMQRISRQNEVKQIESFPTFDDIPVLDKTNYKHLDSSLFQRQPPSYQTSNNNNMNVESKSKVKIEHQPNNSDTDSDNENKQKQSEIKRAKKRRRSTLSTSQQEEICKQYTNANKDGKLNILQKHNILSHDIQNWRAKFKNTINLTTENKISLSLNKVNT